MNSGTEGKGAALAKAMALVRNGSGVPLWKIVVAKEEWCVLDHPSDVTSLCLEQWMAHDSCMHLDDSKADELREEFVIRHLLERGDVGIFQRI